MYALEKLWIALGVSTPSAPPGRITARRSGGVTVAWGPPSGGGLTIIPESGQAPPRSVERASAPRMP